MFTTDTRARRSSSIGAVLALFLGFLMLASPAQAATTVDVTATETTIVLGESVTLNWTSTEASLLTASGDWSGAKTGPDGSEVVTPTVAVTPTVPGTATYTLATDDLDGQPGPSDTVTVEVTAPLPTSVIPEAVAFPGDCTVVVPGTEGVIYSVTVDGETDTIDAGEYDGFEFIGDSAAEFTAAAAEGFVLDPEADAGWTYDAEADCSEDPIVSARAACSAVTFTNIAGEPITVLYGSFSNQGPDGELTIAAGRSTKVKTGRSHVDFMSFTGGDDRFQVGGIAVPQSCGANVGDVGDKDAGLTWPAAHPTSAPAAGVIADNGGGPSLPAMVLLGALGLIAIRRSYALGR